MGIWTSVIDIDLPWLDNPTLLGAPKMLPKTLKRRCGKRYPRLPTNLLFVTFVLSCSASPAGISSSGLVDPSTRTYKRLAVFIPLASDSLQRLAEETLVRATGEETLFASTTVLSDLESASAGRRVVAERRIEGFLQLGLLSAASARSAAGESVRDRCRDFTTSEGCRRQPGATAEGYDLEVSWDAVWIQVFDVSTTTEVWHASVVFENPQTGYEALERVLWELSERLRAERVVGESGTA